MSYAPGQIVLVDWRDGLPKEPNKKRPAVVVEDRGLFDDAYPNLILAPLAEDPHLANGCTKLCYALAHHVTTTSKHRITPTPSRITDGQLVEIRRLIGIAIGLDNPHCH